jgi:Protein of unknown function (DUF732)
MPQATNVLPMATMTLMAEQVPAGDEIGALNSDETIVAPNSSAPDAVDSTWLSDDDDDIPDAPETGRQSWRATWRQAGLLVMGGLALAGAIVVAFWLVAPATKAVQPSSALPSPTTPPPSAPATASAPTAAPPSIASTPDQDNKYVEALNDQGIAFANPEAAIYNGKLVCDDIRQKMTVPQIVAAFRASNPALGSHADTYVSISVHTYCPQNDNLVGGGS